MFTAEQAPPPLIAGTMFEVAPWATYLLLLVESKSYSTFYQFLYEAFVKKDKTTVEQAVKVSTVLLKSMEYSLLDRISRSESCVKVFLGFASQQAGRV